VSATSIIVGVHEGLIQWVCVLSSWHEWACAGNISGCPWIGHSNASRIFDGYVATVGHGGVLNFNAGEQAHPSPCQHSILTLACPRAPHSRALVWLSIDNSSGCEY
jgi:hypothetical protein